MATQGYDYIILGAGSAGCVLANRLSTNASVRVLLVEAGGRDRNPLIKVPLMAGYWFMHRYFNWSFETEPQAHMAGRRISWPRGKVWGGSSSINGMIYVRGHPLDYEGWAGNELPQWDWDGVLPFYRKAECFTRGGDALHGGDGHLPVSRIASDHPLARAFVEATQQAGYPYCDDFNNADPVGVGFYDYNIRNGERWSSARSYLLPVLDRPNLDVMSNSHVRRIQINGGRATGVDIIRGGKIERIDAAREVIVSGGTIGSPTILLHSGIGPADRLKAVGVDPVHDLPGVGQNLHDHLQAVVSHATQAPDNFHQLRRLDKVVPALVQAVTRKSGPATQFPICAGAFLKTSDELAMPDIQIHYILGTGKRDPRLPFVRQGDGYDGYGFNGSTCQLRPQSRGEIFLKSADPLAAPGIQPNYLQEEVDRTVMRQGVHMMRDIFAQAGFDPYRGEELNPGSDVRSDAEIDAWIAQSAAAIYHPVGTCRMGQDDQAVVDDQLRVHGIDCLRVIDASVMPSVIGGNTHGATVMIAEKAADMIINGGSVAAPQVARTG